MFLESPRISRRVGYQVFLIYIFIADAAMIGFFVGNFSSYPFYESSVLRKNELSEIFCLNYHEQNELPTFSIYRE